MHALEYLDQKAPPAPPAICVVYGDEPFLKRLVIAQIRRAEFGDSEDDFSLSVREGKTLEWRDAIDELSTIAMFGGGRRMLQVNDADDFVSKHRAELEDYAEHPKSTGVLVLETGSWPRTTRLFKKLEKTGLQIECKAPTGAELSKWLVRWTKQRHNSSLERDAADLLIETIGPELGLLDQELAKLAVSVGAGEPITPAIVRDLVGGWKAKTTWEMIDAAASGQAGLALQQLDRLLASGETPIGLLAQIGFSLRRFAAAARLQVQAEAAGRRPPLKDSLQAAGVKPAPFLLRKAEEQLKQIGRERALKLYRWLLDADLALKGQSSSPARARMVLETLIARLARPSSARPAPPRSPR